MLVALRKVLAAHTRSVGDALEFHCTATAGGLDRDHGASRRGEAGGGARRRLRRARRSAAPTLLCAAADGKARAIVQDI
jgi:hypothetical protein